MQEITRIAAATGVQLPLVSIVFGGQLHAQVPAGVHIVLAGRRLFPALHRVYVVYLPKTALLRFARHSRHSTTNSRWREVTWFQ
jgi:hypothetical protein